MDKMQIALEAINIVKKFSGVTAVNGVNFKLLKGEIHAVVGQNGAGKTTLLRIFGGVIPPDSGKILVDGVEVKIRDPRDAKKLGITLIHQEATIFPNLSVAENIFLQARAYRDSIFRIFKFNEVAEEFREYLKRVGIEVDPRAKVSSLNVAEQQMIQVARALIEGSRIILLDEPTSSLARPDIEKLFRVMRSLKEEGISMVFVTHRVSEVFEIADRVTVMREGKVVATLPVNNTSEQELVKLMIGRDLKEFYITKDSSDELCRDGPVLKIRNLSTIPNESKVSLNNISFDVCRGEVIGVVGLLRAGKTELGKALVGVEKISGGEIFVEGQRVRFNDPSDALKHGILYLPEDRIREGLVLQMSVRDNIVLPITTKIAFLKLLRNFRRENEEAEKWVKSLNIITPSIYSKVDTLSGGNKQKVLLAKTLAVRPKVLILDEPTLGIDIGAKVEIRRIIKEISEQGVAVILISSDVDEVLSLADRILVLSSGKQLGIYRRGEIQREKLMSLLGVS